MTICQEKLDAFAVGFWKTFPSNDSCFSKVYLNFVAEMLMALADFRIMLQIIVYQSQLRFRDQSKSRFQILMVLSEGLTFRLLQIPLMENIATYPIVLIPPKELQLQVQLAGDRDFSQKAPENAIYFLT